MGANTFGHFEPANGRTRQRAFLDAVEDAAYEYGHGGYTGSLAEKHGFIVCGSVKTVKEAISLANKLIDESDERIDDKWGPAGCINVEEPAGFYFFGWASS